MQMGLIGLGRMGSNMLSRLLAAGHECVVFDVDAEAVADAERNGARGVASAGAVAGALAAPRTVWIMVPAGHVDALVSELAEVLERGDIVIDGGNSHYEKALQHAASLQERGIHHLDVGVSGGVWGREIGYCQMIGGDAEAVARAKPLFMALAQGEREHAAFLHCGGHGAGHYVKMVHNAIEYGLMQAYAEGFNLLKQIESEHQPVPDGLPQLDVELGQVAQLWLRGSVIRSWLLDLTARALQHDPGLESFVGTVADSGEGRWALEAATRHAVPVPALAAALFARFGSRAGDDFANKLLSAMRREFGGHKEPS